MTTAAVLASLYDELIERDVPEHLVDDLMRILAKDVITALGVTVKDTADV